MKQSRKSRNGKAKASAKDKSRGVTKGVANAQATSAGAAGDYNGSADFAGSLDAAYQAIRERVAEGGPAWAPKTRSAPVESVARWPIDKLLPYARNPRTHSPDQVDLIAKSMARFGQAQLILIDGDEGPTKGEIIAGHGRVLASEKLGWKTLMVGLAHGWSEEEKQAYRIADNQIGLTSGWDESLLKVELMALSLASFDLPVLGFTQAEFASFGVGVGEVEFPVLPSAQGHPFQQMTFTLHESQVPLIIAALKLAKSLGPFEGPNANSNGNAIARVCEGYTRGADSGAERERADAAAALQQDGVAEQPAAPGSVPGQ